MGKTNHRVNKDREGRLPEALSHKQRRNMKNYLDKFVELYEYEDVEELSDDFFDDPDTEKRVKIHKNG